MGSVTIFMFGVSVGVLVMWSALMVMAVMTRRALSESEGSET